MTRRRIILFGVAAALAVLLAFFLWPSPRVGEGSGLVAAFRKAQTEKAFRAVTSFVAKQAPVRGFERVYFPEGSNDSGRLRFLLCLDKAMLPVMRDTVRAGSPAKRAAWIESYRSHMEAYRTRMSPAEHGRLRAALATPEGQQLVKDSVQFFYRDLTAADKMTFDPIIREVSAILSSAGAATP